MPGLTGPRRLDLRYPARDAGAGRRLWDGYEVWGGRRASMDKRGQNRGTVYCRRDGRWEGAITLPGTGGRRKRFYAATEEQAERQLAALAGAVAAGEVVVPASPTVGDYLAWWLAAVVKPAKRASTHRSYESLVRLHLRPTLGPSWLFIHPRVLGAMPHVDAADWLVDLRAHLPPAPGVWL